MTTVNLFRPGKLNVYLQFPTAWDELLPAEVIEISRQQLLSSNNIHTAKASIVHFILQSRAKQQKVKLPAGWLQMVDAEQIAVSGTELTDFVYNENTLTKVPEKRIKLPGAFSPEVFGPEENYQNITCGEFEDCEIFFYEFFEKPDSSHLAHIASVLWRPAHFALFNRKHSRLRVPYIQLQKGEYKVYNAEKLYSRFLRLMPWQLYAIFTWYYGCRNQLPLMFPTVHESFGESKNDGPDILAFTKCIHAGAGPKNGNRNQIRQTRLLEYMFEMEQEAIKAKEMKEEYEKLKNQNS